MCVRVYMLFVRGDMRMMSSFFFKQKTAYEMRISDWSSDVCSSDLLAEIDRQAQLSDQTLDVGKVDQLTVRRGESRGELQLDEFLERDHAVAALLAIGRASCRETCVSTSRSRWSPSH